MQTQTKVIKGWLLCQMKTKKKGFAALNYCEEPLTIGKAVSAIHMKELLSLVRLVITQKTRKEKIRREGKEKGRSKSKERRGTN